MKRLQRTTFRLLGRTQHRQAHSLTLAIRREDPQRIWERRCPLTPAAVDELVKEWGVKVQVQPCERRIWKDSEFERVGATINDNVDDAHIIVGIKETPLSELITTPVQVHSQDTPNAPVSRTHIMFSHTAKGQAYNIPLLSRFLAGDTSFPPSAERDSTGYGYPRLIDFELLTDENGKRTVAFGWFAGVAGVLESLSSMAHKHLEEGVASPFLYTTRPHTYPNLSSLKEALRNIGNMIEELGTPKRLGPMVFCVTGNGNVAQGCLDILKELPIVNVSVGDLPNLVTNPDTPLNKIYLVHALPQDYLVRTDGRPYSRDHYYQHPELYTSQFSSKVFPYLTLLLNGVGWVPGYPRLMSNSQLQSLQIPSLAREQLRGKVVGDISCDVNGGLEFLTRSSTLSSPDYNILVGGDGVAKEIGVGDSHPDSVKLMAVDILPTGIPLDASESFSSAFLPYLKETIGEYQRTWHKQGMDIKSPAIQGGGRGSLDMDVSINAALERATIAKEGRLMPKHEWLGSMVRDWRGGSGSESIGRHRSSTGGGANNGGIVPKKKVLMLGSGMVARPAVDVLAQQSDVKLLIATNMAKEADALIARYPDVDKRIVDLSDRAAVAPLIAEADLVISLLPVGFHPAIAKLCVEHGTNMVTASYISPAMSELHDDAIKADVLLLNEIGLDPGVDHCSAIKLINDIHSSGKIVRSFTSFCGGLPAPECSDVPLRYKFSWSPRGVLAAALNGATFKLGGRKREISGERLLRDVFERVPVARDVADFEGIANRHSLPYAETYKLGDPDGKELRTCLRGTLRYPGFSSLMDTFKSLGLLSTDDSIQIDDWKSLVSKSSGGRRVDIDESAQGALDWLLGVGSHPLKANANAVLPSIPKKPMAPIDLFSILLANRLRYEPHERDMVVLGHEVVASAPGSLGGVEEDVYTSELVCFGSESERDGGGSAMSKCVGIPVALASLRVLRGEVGARGVWGPGVERGVWQGVLEGMEERGYGMKESVRRKMKMKMGNGNGGSVTVEGTLLERWGSEGGR